MNELNSMLFVLPLAAATLLLFALASCLRRLGLARDEARTDALTGLGNRRRWQERLDGLQLQGAPFALILFDVANFKAVNTALGHDGADRVLARIASHLREGDRLGIRMGGDEFGIILEGASPAFAGSLRGAIERRVGLLEPSPGVLSFISGGVATWGPGDSLEDALRTADLEMEQRKEQRKISIGLASRHAG